jgi:hypothetical protein
MARKRRTPKGQSDQNEDPFKRCLQILRALPPASDQGVGDWCLGMVGWQLPEASDQTDRTKYTRFLKGKLVALRNILDGLPKAKAKRALELVALLLAFRSHDTVMATLRTTRIALDQLEQVLLQRRTPSERVIRRNVELIRRREGDPKRWSLEELRKEYFPDGVIRNVTKVLE